MNDELEMRLKNEINEIAEKIDTIMQKIDALTPETKEEKSQEEQPMEDRPEISKENEEPLEPNNTNG